MNFQIFLKSKESYKTLNNSIYHFCKNFILVWSNVFKVWNFEMFNGFFIKLFCEKGNFPYLGY